MSSDLFHFREFTLIQAGAGMRISTDGVLLGAWSTLPELQPGLAIDVGCGTGVLSFMLAQRLPALKVHAYEIDHDSFVCARKNLEHFPQPHRISLFEGDFVSCYSEYYQPHSVGLLISNPPYYCEGPPTKNVSRQVARYTDSLTTENLFRAASYLLVPMGRLAIITPMLSKPTLLREAFSHGMCLLRETEVITVEGKIPKRWLSEWGPQGGEPSLQKPLASRLILKTRQGSYSEEYKNLVAPFYRKGYLDEF